MEKRLFKRKASDTDWVLFMVDLQRMLKTNSKVIMRPLFEKHHIGHFPTDAVIEMRETIVNADARELVTTVLEDLRDKAREYHASRNQQQQQEIRSDIFGEFERIKSEIDNAIEKFRTELYEHYNIKSEESRGVAEE